MKSKLEILKENLKVLIELNPKGEYKIGRCLSSKEIELFESRHNIKLPKEYIEFVTEIGSFGFGPNEGFLPLSQYNDLRHRLIENDLSVEFPFTEKKEDDELYGYEYDSLMNGAILVSDCGCGDFEILIVNGTEYGNVWGDYRVSCNGMKPLLNTNNERLTFLDWYNLFILKKIEYYENYDPQKIENMIKGLESKRTSIPEIKDKKSNSITNFFKSLFK